MPSRIMCVRIPQPLLASLIAFCAERGEQPSVVVRDALTDLLEHPERHAELAAARRANVLENLRSEMAHALE